MAYFVSSKGKNMAKEVEQILHFDPSLKKLCTSSGVYFKPK